MSEDDYKCYIVGDKDGFTVIFSRDGYFVTRDEFTKKQHNNSLEEARKAAIEMALEDCSESDIIFE